MYIKCWGSRGSIPVSGNNYLKYGGDTTCIEIRNRDNQVIIVDAGTGIRRLGNQLLLENQFEYHLFFTHVHWDHIMGIPFFKPLFDPRTCLWIYQCPFPGNFIKSTLKKVLSPPSFPLPLSDLESTLFFKKACPDNFAIGTMEIQPFALSHPDKGYGYKFTENGKSFVFIPDNEFTYKHPGGPNLNAYVEFAKGADLLIHDAEFTPEEYPIKKGWGHSSYADTLELAMDAGVKKLGLFHHNQERTDKEVDNIVSRSRNLARSKGCDIEIFGTRCDMEIKI